MKRVTFDEIDAVECRIKSAFLKEKESECNQKGAEKEPKKGAEKRSRKKAGYIAEIGRKSRDNSD